MDGSVPLSLQRSQSLMTWSILHLVLRNIVPGDLRVLFFVAKYANPVYLVVVVAASAIILGTMLYLSLKIDWAKIIGKYFPWTLTDGTDKKEDSSKTDN